MDLNSSAVVRFLSHWDTNYENLWPCYPHSISVDDMFIIFILHVYTIIMMEAKRYDLLEGGSIN